MKKIVYSFLTLLIGGSFWLVQADDLIRVQGFTVTPVSSGKELYLKWSPLSAEKISGYALQWSDKQSDMRIDKPMRLEFEQNTASAYIRGADFEYNSVYYFRVYTYYDNPVSNKRIYYSDKSSKIMKWTLLNRSSIDTEWIEPSDPLIVVSDDVTSDGFPDVDFGVLRALPFDTVTQFLWSNSNLAASDFDGHQLLVSTSADLSSPVVTMEAGRSDRKAFLEGLEPNTTYYARAAFYKTANGTSQFFGESDVITFKTVPQIVGRKLGSFERTMARMRKSGIGQKFSTGVSKDSTVVTTVSNSATNPSSSSVTVRSSSRDTESTSSLRARIRTLNAEISERKKEVPRLEKLLGTSASTSSSNRSTRSTTSSTRSTAKLSLRERMLKRLNR